MPSRVTQISDRHFYSSSFLPRATIRSGVLLKKSSCLSVLWWWRVCVWKVILPSHPWVSQICSLVCDQKNENMCTSCFYTCIQDAFICQLHLILGLQWWLKEDVTLQTIAVSQLITMLKVATCLSWHLRSVWITHSMSDRQIACAPQIFRVVLPFQRHRMEPSWSWILLIVFVFANIVCVCLRFLVIRMPRVPSHMLCIGYIVSQRL